MQFEEGVRIMRNKEASGGRILNWEQVWKYTEAFQ